MEQYSVSEDINGLRKPQTSIGNSLNARTCPTAECRYPFRSPLGPLSPDVPPGVKSAVSSEELRPCTGKTNTHNECCLSVKLSSVDVNGLDEPEIIM